MLNALTLLALGLVLAGFALFIGNRVGMMPLVFGSIAIGCCIAFSLSIILAGRDE